MTIDQIALVDPGTTTLYRLLVKCSSKCYLENRNQIDTVVAALLPALLNQRLPELGIDFALIYPSLGLALNGIAEDDLRRAAARAYNMMTADMFAPYAARFAPVAIIPVHTPEEAIEELDYAVGKLAYRAIMLKGNQERPIPSAAARHRCQ